MGRLQAFFYSQHMNMNMNMFDSFKFLSWLCKSLLYTQDRKGEIEFLFRIFELETKHFEKC